MKICFNLMVFTRSSNFDYQWILGIKDSRLQSELERYVIKWLGINDLAQLPPILTFFKFDRYFALMLAQKSETRRDSSNIARPIYERAMLLWEADEPLPYDYLVPLESLLIERSSEVYRDIPTKSFGVPVKYQQVELDLATLKKGVKKNAYNDPLWQLPGGFTWEDIVRDRLTVEIPYFTEFNVMLSGLGDLRMSTQDPIFIGKGLPASYRHPKDRSWVLSSPNPDIVSPRILDSKGLVIEYGDRKAASRITTAQTSQPTREFYLDSTEPPNGKDTDNVSDQAKEVDTIPLPGNEPRRQETPNGKFSQFDLELVEKYIVEASQTLSQMADKSYSGFFFKFTPKKELELKVYIALLRMIFLLSSIPQLCSFDIIIRWLPLLSEIMKEYGDSLPDKKEQWVNHIVQLYDLTIASENEVSQTRMDEFYKAYSILQNILEAD